MYKLRYDLSQVNQLLSAREVAICLSISLRRFEQLLADGVGPPFLRIGRQRRWRRWDVDDWIAKQLPAGVPIPEPMKNSGQET
jgi:excisionase family DNA binding protein